MTHEQLRTLEGYDNLDDRQQAHLLIRRAELEVEAQNKAISAAIETGVYRERDRIFNILKARADGLRRADQTIASNAIRGCMHAIDPVRTEELEFNAREEVQK